MGLSSKLASSDVSLDWSQELLENGGLQIPKPMNQARNNQQQQQRQHWPPLKCPRCESTNTKFCYYNNYSRSQPRHFCKSCRRHWTEGGTLRNVPVGGGRKNKRSKTTPATSAAAATSTTASGTAAKMNSISSTSLPLAQQQQQQQQQKFPLLFGGDHSSNIFPEILRQVLLRPPPSDHSFTSSLWSDPILPPQFKPAVMNSGDGNNSNNTPFSISSSSYSYPLASATEECLATINPSSAASAWQVGQVTAFPMSTSDMDHSSADYWSSWDDDMAGCS